jgi:predicted nucleic acid-binding protein
LSAYVLDASVAAKWYLPAGDEPLQAEARWILDEHRRGRIELLAPDLLWPEVGSVLRKAVRRGRIRRSRAEESMAAFLEQGVATQSSQPLLGSAFSIACDLNQSIYDAIYVALGISLNMPVVTADRRMYQAFGREFAMRWLGAMTRSFDILLPPAGR